MDTHILLIGVNHTQAPIALRERLAIRDADLTHALSRCGQSHEGDPALFPECVILSTCNRLEIYAVTDDAAQGRERLVQFLSQFCQVPVSEFAGVLDHQVDEDAVTHLTRVACGLESMVVGEPQILGQVTDAYQAALDCQATGPVLNTLYRHAIRAGKRARTETAISQYATSVPSASATLAEREVQDLKDRVVLVMGAGDMGQIAARAMVTRGVGDLIVANRTYERGLTLASQLDGEAIAFERQAEALARADVVVTATGAPQPILTSDQVAVTMAERPQRPLLIIDIAVPRDTDPAVAHLPGVRLFDIDDLQEVVNGNLEARQREIPRVEAIAAEEARAFLDWFHLLDVIPTIVELRRRAETIKRQELDKALRRLGDVDDRQQEVVRAMAHGLLNKLLHEPTVRLKHQAAQGDGQLYADTVRELFGLELPRSGPSANGSEADL